MKISTARPSSGKGKILLVFLKQSLFVCVFIALQCASPALVFAAVTNAAIPLEFGRKEALDRAGVSVVRLLVSYNAPGAKVPDVQCTGLGVLVDSWPGFTGNPVPNNWVLADGNLININNSATCLPPNVIKKLTPTVQVFYSNAYTAGAGPVFSDPITLDADTVRCETPTCKDGLALLAFRTDATHPQPFLDLITTEKQGDGLALTNAGGQISLSPVNTQPDLADAYKATITQLLTPNLVSREQVNESWLPLINTHGQLVGVQSTSGNGNTFTPSTTIKDFLDSIEELKAHPSNFLHDSWNSGIDNYYNSRFANAQQDFQTASKLNAQFLAAQKMEELAATAKPPVGASPTETPWSPPSGSTLLDWDMLLIWLLVAAIAVAVLRQALKFFLSVVGVIRTMRQRVLEKEFKRLANIKAKRIRRQAEQEQQKGIKQFSSSVQAGAVVPLVPVMASKEQAEENKQLNKVQKGPGETENEIILVKGEAHQAQQEVEALEKRWRQTTLSCPHCAALVPRNAKYCSSCRFLLPTSNSALYPHITNAMPIPAIQNQPSVATPMASTTPVEPKSPFNQPPVVAEMSLPKDSKPPVTRAKVETNLPQDDKLPIVLVATDTQPPKDEKLPVLPAPAELPHEAVKVDVPIYQVMKSREGQRVGDRLGNYRLARLIGHGGFADVYLAEHRFLKTQAAIKVLHTRLTKDTMVKFINEARTIATLVHPHIIRVLEFGMEGDEPDLEQSFFNSDGCIPFLIMDYAPGKTLRHRHPKGTRLPLATVVSYVKDVAEALQYAHDKKLIHRDVKPENMLIGHHNEVLLGDFGIAAVAHSERSMIKQELAGTAPYIAPEQIRGGPQLASDQYSLGIVTYEWLCGERPFQGESQVTLVVQHLTEPPPPLRQKMPSLSPIVEEVVMKALEKHPTQRFASVKAFATALEQAAKQAL